MRERVSGCRSCGSPGFERILSLGDVPLANALMEAGEATAPTYPLDVAVCPSCSLVQVEQTVPPEAIFDGRYRYRSSFSDELVEHGRRNARRLIASRGLGPRSLVVEIGSNDGALLRSFADAGVPVLGIDPARHPVAAAAASGIPTMRAFFDAELGRELAEGGKRADVVVANNVLAHVPDPGGLLSGIAALLGEDGVASIEVAYVRDLVDRAAFDTIYHEHVCYFSATSLAPLFARNGLRADEVERLPVHGGSLRLRASRGSGMGGSVRELLAEESRAGVDRVEHYRAFADRVRGLQGELSAMLRGLRGDGYRIAAYGAAAKGTTLLASSGIGADVIDFVVDRNVDKQGLRMPGLGIPIRDPESLLDERPDYVVLLTWNFAGEILRQQDAYRRAGGRFIIPIPRPRVA